MTRTRQQTTTTTARLTAPRLPVALAAATCLHGIAASSLAVALPDIIGSLHASSVQAGLVLTAFFVGAALTVPLAGRAADLLGTRRLLLIGLTVVMAASALAAAATTVVWLIIARAVLGMATASLHPAAITTLRRSNLATELPAVMLASEAMFGLGPLIGGLGVGAGGWRVSCLILVPVAAVALLLVAVTVPPSDAASAPSDRPDTRIDVIGAGLFSLVIAGLLTVLLVPVGLGWWQVAVPLILCCAVFALIMHSRRHPHPFVDLQVLAASASRASFVRTGVLYLATYLVIYSLPIWLQQHGLSATAAGATLVPVAVVSVASIAIAGPRLHRGPTARMALLAGSGSLVVAGVGMWLLPLNPAVCALIVLAAVGITSGAANLGNQHVMVTGAPNVRMGSVAATGRCVQFVAGQLASVLVARSAVGTDIGLRVVGVAVLVLSLALAVTAVVVVGVAIAVVLAMALTGCGTTTPRPAPKGPVDYLGVQVISTIPAPPRNFVEGLEFSADGRTLLESTGLSGQSQLRMLDAATGTVLHQIPVPDGFFGEGTTLLPSPSGSTAWQLTWRDHVAIRWDLSTWREIGRVRMDGEGWGLCHQNDHGDRLISSDGSDELVLRDPDTFAVTGHIHVTRGDGRGVGQLNELECLPGVNGVLANEFGSTEILRINLGTGEVTAAIDASSLPAAAGSPVDPDAVLNGIAADPHHPDQLVLTGKRWPVMFRCRVVPAPQPSTSDTTVSRIPSGGTR